MIPNIKTASVTELRQNATSLLDEVASTHEPIFILQHSKKAAVLLDEATYTELVQAHMDQRDYELAAEAFKKKEKTYTFQQIEKMRTLKK